MPKTEGFVTYSEMDSFIKDNTSIQDISALFNRAKSYFVETSKIRDYIDPMIPPLDIYNCSEETFEKITEKFPIPISRNRISNEVVSSEIIPPNAECFLTRHLNHLKNFVHFHDFFEIVYVMRGSCKHKINSTEFTMSQGDILIIPPLIKHNLSVTDKTSMIFNICIREEVFSNTFFYILALDTPLSLFFRNILTGDTSNDFLLIHTRRDIFLNRIIRHIAFNCYATTATTNIFTSSVVSQVFEFIIRDGIIEDRFFNPINENLSVSSVIHYIQRNYRSITLSQLTEVFNVNEAYLSRCIKKATNYSFSELLSSIRIERARQLLVRTDCNLDTIAEIIGYIDSNSLAKAFKRKMGVSPLQYRKEYTPTTDKNVYY